MSSDPAFEFLSSLGTSGVRPGLDGVRSLAAAAGNPQDRLRFVHVAGTNGKGSTCAFLESVLRLSGLKVGLFTSPHLVSLTERIQVDRAPVPHARLAELIRELRAIADARACAEPYTFFDFITVLAWMHFARESCDAVILETGLGGRLDSTNLVTPLASIITTVDLEHTAWLGDTLAKIAYEKAGILKPRVPGFTAVDQSEALTVIRARADELAAPLTAIRETSPEFQRARALELKLRGEHQTLNAALAIAAARSVAPALKCDIETTLERALESATLPGRLQIETLPNGRTILLDGAHNPAGARTLRAALDALMPPAEATLLIGVMSDKDWRSIVEAIVPGFRRVAIVRVENDRALDPERLAAEVRNVSASARVEVYPSVEAGLRGCANSKQLVITGSLYVVGEAMQSMGLAPGVTPDPLPLVEKLTPPSPAQ